MEPMLWSRVRRLLAGDSRTLDDLGDLYHDYSVFGYRNRQRPGCFSKNQQCKAPVIGGYIQLAIAKSRNHVHDGVSFAELFCADGYYAMLARHFGATESIGIDNDRDGHFDSARTIADRIGITNVRFFKKDVHEIDTLPDVDIVANVGGLYHLENPVEVLTKSYAMARKFLIVQSVVSMANDDPNYFEMPAPGWTWGSRFNRCSFDALIAELGYRVIDQHFNELEGNERPEDRGSVYYLIDASPPVG